MNKLEQEFALIEEQKEQQVKGLIDQVKASKDIRLVTRIMFFLVENFKSASIFPLLLELIKEERYKDYNGSLIYLCGEYSLYECSNQVDFFIELIAHNDGEVGMTAFNILLDAANMIDFEEENLERWRGMLNKAKQNRPTYRYLQHALNWLD